MSQLKLQVNNAMNTLSIKKEGDLNDKVIIYFKTLNLNNKLKVIDKISKLCNINDKGIIIYTIRYIFNIRKTNLWNGRNDKGNLMTKVYTYGKNKSKCGYCAKNAEGKNTYGMVAYMITANDYQELACIGWRRSGVYLYKPNNIRSCCPNYSIRLNIKKFYMSKSQKKCLRRFNNYILNKENKKCVKIKSDKLRVSDVVIKTCKSNLNRAIKRAVDSGRVDKVTLEYSLDLCKIFYNYKNLKNDKKNTYNVYSNIGHSLNAFLKKRNVKTNGENAMSKLINDNLDKNIRSKCKGGMIIFEIEDVDSSISNVYKEKHNKIKGEKCKKTSNLKNNKREFSIEILPSRFNKEDFEVYKKYQKEVHKEEATEEEYKNFLCESPIIYEKSENLPCHLSLGSFHMCLRIDGNIVYIGVIDILPNYLNSMYLFFDPKYSFLNPGVLSALKEIELAKEIYDMRKNKDFYYSMGYYIQSCPKMSYKGNFKPTEILCPLRYIWVPLEKCIELMKKFKYVVFSDLIEHTIDIPNKITESEKNRSLLLIQNSLYEYGDFKEYINNKLDKFLLKFGNLIGAKLLNKIVIVNWNYSIIV